MTVVEPIDDERGKVVIERGGVLGQAEHRGRKGAWAGGHHGIGQKQHI